MNITISIPAETGARMCEVAKRLSLGDVELWARLRLTAALQEDERLLRESETLEWPHD